MSSDKTPQRVPTADERQAMLTLHGEGWSVREIGKELGWSAATVGRHLNRMGADMDRSQTQEATNARVRLLKAKRVELAEQLFEDARSMRHRVWDEYIVVTNGPDGPDLVRLDEPPLKEQADGIRALDTTIATVDRLLDGAANHETDAAKNVIMGIFSGLAKLTGGEENSDPDDRDHDYDIADDPDEEKGSASNDDEPDFIWVDCDCEGDCDCEETDEDEEKAD